MERQRIRKGIIFSSFLLFPVTIFYFSPVLIIQAAARGIVSGSFITFILLFLGSLFLGRAWCGWVCPGAGLTEACFMIREKKAPGSRWNWIKYALWFPWMGSIILLAVKAGGLHRIDPLYQMDHGISVLSLPALIIYFAFVALIVILSLTAGRRGFCHYVCWMAPFMVFGDRLKNRMNWPALHLESTPEKCIQCGACQRNCPMSLDVKHMVQQRTMKNPECILCGSCVDHCPEKVIGYKFGRRN